MIAVAPGKCGLGTFAPLLDRSGNSIKGQLTARFLSEELGLNLFASRPDREGRDSLHASAGSLP
jgi:glutaminase